MSSEADLPDVAPQVLVDWEVDRLLDYEIADEARSRVLRFLALPYADHPDYRPEWRP